MLLILLLPFVGEAFLFSRNREPPPPLHHTTNLTEVELGRLRDCITQGACSTAFNKCEEDPECSAVVDGEYLNKSLRQRRSLPPLGRNDAMRTLSACADSHCFERSCRHRQERLSHVTTSCHSPPCHLTNDLVRTLTVDECEERCLAHAPPIYSELCGAYTWIQNARIDDAFLQHTCFLFSSCRHDRSSSYSRGAISGMCSGGPRPDSQLVGVAGICDKLASDSRFLRSWLRARRGVKLDGPDLDDLFHYISLVDMCPLDRDFDETLQKFLKNRRLKKAAKKISFIKKVFTFVVDVVEAVVDLSKKINPSFFLTLLFPLLPKLRLVYPKLAESLAPLLEKLETSKKTKKKK